MNPEILNIIYIASIAIGSFTGFCITVWGVWWKVSQVRKKDLQAQDDNTSKAKSAGIEAANAVRKDLEHQNSKQWDELKKLKDDTEAELERKVDQLHKLRDDEKRERHQQELIHTDRIAELRGSLNTLKEFIKK